ncbi:MAG: PBP1A family penicillin-binding protein, partial [Chloroflexi bacterium]|nr:PBP1A family penicillin-binding protein [Chloroflexota bacterium]
MQPLPRMHQNGRPHRPLRNHLGPTRRSRTGYIVAGALTLMLLLAFGLAGTATFGAASAAAAYHSFIEDLPSVGVLSTRDVYQTTRILDRDGNLLYELFNQDEGRRTVVRLDDVPNVVVDAVVAVEDASFYENLGIEPRGIIRAFWENLQAGTVVGGGSTITQQLIKNVLLNPDERTSETLSRKFKEAFLAMELSQSYSKDQILEWYLNEVSFGNLAFGIGTASQTYFTKSLQEVTLAEAAFLAGLPQAPATYDPFTSFEAAKQRQEDVLGLMAQHGFITPEEADAAKQEPIKLAPPESATPSIRYPHWVFYVRNALEERFGEKALLTGGYTVYTTLDSDLQDIAERSVRTYKADLEAQNANNASLAAIDPKSGEILAMVGSMDYYDASIDGQVNQAVAPLQPGSSIKPVVYLTAFLEGLSPATIVQDAPLELPDGPGRVWRPQNFDNRFRGPVTLRRALGNSLNIPAVKVLQYVGLDDAISMAKNLGMTSLGDPTNYGLSFTLGGGEVRLVELASAYAVLANGGKQVPVSPILKVVGADGRTVYEHTSEAEQVVDPRTVFLTTDILSDNNARLETFGANSPLRLSGNRPAAAKTGSTDDYRDSWTMGYTPSLVAGVWVGR